jgi:uncharacterized protein (TIGR02266 family)
MYPIASEETYNDGQIIFNEGSWGDWVYVIQSGSVEISRTITEKKFILSLLEQGEVFGELGYLGVIERTATARAIGKTTLGVIDRTFLDKEFNKLSAYFRTILVTAVKRFRNHIERSCEFSTRNDVRVQKRLTLSFKDSESFVRAYTGNISRGGLFIQTNQPLKQGEQFSLKLQLPGIPQPMEIECEVVWSREQNDTQHKSPGMGVKFCEITQGDSQMLNQYLQELIQNGKIDS